MTIGSLDQVLEWVRRTAAAGDGGPTDGELLERFVATGDESAFELLVWRHQRLVYGVCRRVLRNAHDADDAFQATFVILARKGRSIGQGASLAAWLYKVAYRCALTARAARVRVARREQSLAAAGECADAAAALSPAEQHELGVVLDDELNRLPERFRTPAVLCYLTGKTVDEVAIQLGCPRGTVASRLARARQRLRSRLVNRGVTPAALAALAIGATTTTAAPEGLVRATGELLHPRTAGSAASGAALAERVLRTMFIRKLLLGAALVTAFALTLAAGGSRAFQDSAPAPEPQAPQANVAPDQPVAVQPKPPVPFQDFVGTLEPSQAIQVRARVGGQIERVHVKEGDAVKQGQLLFTIDARRAKVDLEQALAELAQVQAKRESAVLRHGRTKALEKNKVVSREEVIAAAQDLAAVEASHRAAQAAADRARLDLDAHRILAPVAGRIDRLPVDAGNRVAADGSTALATLIVTDPMTLRFAMNERTFLRYRNAKKAGKDHDVGVHFAIAAADEDGFPHGARLMQVGTSFDPATRTVAVRASVANPKGEFLPGMVVRVRVTFVAAPEKAAP